MGIWALLTVAGSLLGQGMWERRAPYPIQATEVSAAALNGKIYSVCGLLPDGSRSTTLYVYDPYQDAWETGPAVPIPGGGDHCNVASTNGKLYVLGAIRIGTQFIDGNTYEFDPARKRWSTVGRMNQPRGASGVAVIGSRIYVAGGLTLASVATMEAFDVETRQWIQLPNMPTPRDHLTAQTIAGKFYAIGGRIGGTECQRE